ncbi:sugar phosphate isomerase/epimerase family protein [Micrococcaceae bacterium Sec5.7]
MKIGLSSYSLAGALADGRLGVADLVDWAADAGAGHLELADAGLGADLSESPALRTAVTERAAERGMELGNYVVGADFSGPDAPAEVARIRKHLDAAAELGITRFRHDVVPWGWQPADHREFREACDAVVPACRELADYAADLGITTSVENHGMAFNLSERLLALVHAVDRENFRITLDIGNFLCLDEAPEAAIPRLLPYASIVHLKDFYIRRSAPGAGWLKTAAGNYIQGSVFGLGDLDMERIAGIIRDSGYDGPLSIEYEGREDCLTAVPDCLENAGRLLQGSAA